MSIYPLYLPEDVQDVVYKHLHYLCLQDVLKELSEVVFPVEIYEVMYKDDESTIDGWKNDPWYCQREDVWINNDLKNRRLWTLVNITPLYAKAIGFKSISESLLSNTVSPNSELVQNYQHTMSIDTLFEEYIHQNGIFKQSAICALHKVCESIIHTLQPHVQLK